jgi:hypothetical protein
VDEKRNERNIFFLYISRSNLGKEEKELSERVRKIE